MGGYTLSPLDPAFYRFLGIINPKNRTLNHKPKTLITHPGSWCPCGPKNPSPTNQQLKQWEAALACKDPATTLEGLGFRV